MNLTDKARKGNREAMECLVAMTKTDVLHLSLLLIGDEQAVGVIIPRVYRNLWDQVLSGKITTEEEFSQAALLKAASFCKAAVGKKDSKAFRIPQNRDFVQGVGESIQAEGEAWEVVLQSLPTLHRFLYVLNGVYNYTPAQLAKLFHTNEETIEMALQAETTNLNRILATASRKTGKRLSLTPKEFHGALERKLLGTELSPSTEQAILVTMNALCKPIRKKLNRKRRRLAVAMAAVAVVVCFSSGMVWAAVSESSQAEEDTTSSSSTTEDTAEEVSSDSETTSDSTATDSETTADSAGASETSQVTGSETESSDTTDTAAEVNATAYADVVIQDYGTITIALDGDAAPETVENFISLAESGFYDGLTFHRIIDGFMMQGGDPNGDGTGGSEETIPGEFTENGFENNLSHTRGAVSMARSEDYDSASSQFFIVQEDSTYLDGEYAVFGYVTEGMDIVDEICENAQPTDDNGTIPAEEQPVITSITIRDVEEEQAA